MTPSFTIIIGELSNPGYLLSVVLISYSFMSADTVAAQQSGRLKKLLAGSASAVNAENLKSEL